MRLVDEAQRCFRRCAAARPASPGPPLQLAACRADLGAPQHGPWLGRLYQSLPLASGSASQDDDTQQALSWRTSTCTHSYVRVACTDLRSGYPSEDVGCAFSPPGDLAGAAAGMQAVVEAREAGGHPSEAALLLHLATLRARFPLPPVAESATTAILGFRTRLAQTPTI